MLFLFLPSWSILAWTCAGDPDGPSIYQLLMQSGHRLLGFGRIRHVHQSEPASPPGFRIADHVGGRYLAEGRESRRKLVVREVEGEVADKKMCHAVSYTPRD